MEEAKTTKDDLYIEAKEEFDVTLDRRKTLENAGSNGPAPQEWQGAERFTRIPKTLRNIIASVEWPYSEGFAKNLTSK